MSRAHGQIRRGQVITTYGPGALLDLPNYSVIVGGLDTWPNPSRLEPIAEPRLTRKLQDITGVASPGLFVPPPDSSDPSDPMLSIGVWRFPEWFVVQDEGHSQERERSRRLVPLRALDSRSRFEGKKVVATRFVRTCPRGHVDDLQWHRFVHGDGDACKRQLWLDERGTSGDLGDLFVRCECKKSRSMYEANQIELKPLDACTGARPWLGANANEPCGQPARLLIRTASNSYFSQVVSVLSLPNRGSAVEKAVRELWDDLQIVHDTAELDFVKRKPSVKASLEPFSDGEVMETINEVRSGGATEKPVKQVELDALLAAQEGFGDDIPVDPDFHARRLPDQAWRKSKRFDEIQGVIQLHRLREVLALIGFTRLEAVMPDIQGEFETDVERAQIAIEPAWFPAVENRGEGVFIQLRAEAVGAWLEKGSVKRRLEALSAGHNRWIEDRRSKRPFPGGPYILTHTLSHVLIQSLALRCGYPASSIRERIYTDVEAGRLGVLLFTGSPDAAGTLGGLVHEAKNLEGHLENALRSSALCSNDPICAQHKPGESMEKRWLHGAACHGCTLVAETSCEMRNDYLDRALLVPVIGSADAAFFSLIE